jgi:hypothetical protein
MPYHRSRTHYVSAARIVPSSAGMPSAYTLHIMQLLNGMRHGTPPVFCGSSISCACQAPRPCGASRPRARASLCSTRRRNVRPCAPNPCAACSGRLRACTGPRLLVVSPVRLGTALQQAHAACTGGRRSTHGSRHAGCERRAELWTLSLRARMVLQVEACKNHITSHHGSRHAVRSWLAGGGRPATWQAARAARCGRPPPALTAAGDLRKGRAAIEVAVRCAALQRGRRARQAAHVKSTSC